MAFSYTNDGKINEMDSVAVCIKIFVAEKSDHDVSSRIPTIPQLFLPIALATVATLRMLVVSSRNKLNTY
jgi:hypothetical protein